MAEPLLQVKGLEIKYHTREGILTAIRNASFDVHEGEIVGVVGESGCGKSTVASAGKTCASSLRSRCASCAVATWP